MKYFLDTYALVEIAKGNEEFSPLLDKEAVTMVDNLAEFYYAMLKASDARTADKFLSIFLRMTMHFPARYVKGAMQWRHQKRKMKFSYVDSMGYYFSQEMGCTFVTGDKTFAGMPGTLLVRS
jgi:predicted nucleic acid-binding protein